MTAVIPDLLFHRKGSWREAASAAVGLRPSRSDFCLAEPQKAVKRSSRRTGGNLQLFGVEPAALGLSASPTRMCSAQETMRKKASRPRHARMLGAATRGTKQQPTGLIAYPAAHRRPVSGCGSQRMLHALKRRSHPADHGPSFASLYSPFCRYATSSPDRGKSLLAGSGQLSYNSRAGCMKQQPPL